MQTAEKLRGAFMAPSWSPAVPPSPPGSALAFGPSFVEMLWELLRGLRRSGLGGLMLGFTILELGRLDSDPSLQHVSQLPALRFGAWPSADLNF